ncbi:tRNA (adenosine(37)-N6)-dimethylallyltransferase MiaA [Streptococcus hongkongensis]|nr:tRNA delta(2)-isopentenylpyrophosphate transferase [Streptococcus uberis]
MKNKEKIIVVIGPTAVGKTAMGINLAEKFNGEIISGDSQQVYKGLDIGTAKASKSEMRAVPHHLIDIKEVTESYSAFDFVEDAKEAIKNIEAKGKLPIIVGGTGLYIQSLIEGYHLGGQVNQSELLNYRQELELLSDLELFQLLDAKEIVIEQVNRRRAIRALELDKFALDLENKEFPYDVLLIGLDDERSVIYDRINQRVDKMVESGLLEEAQWLFENHPKAQASRGIGYKELFPYFQGELSLEACLDKLKQNTRRFAKRQLTWFRNRMQVTFFQISDPDYLPKVDHFVNQFLEK